MILVHHASLMTRRRGKRLFSLVHRRIIIRERKKKESDKRENKRRKDKKLPVESCKTSACRSSGKDSSLYSHF